MVWNPNLAQSVGLISISICSQPEDAAVTTARGTSEDGHPVCLAASLCRWDFGDVFSSLGQKSRTGPAKSSVITACTPYAAQLEVRLVLLLF